MRAEQGMHGKPLLAGFKPIKSGKCFSFNYFGKSHYGFDMYSVAHTQELAEMIFLQHFRSTTFVRFCLYFGGLRRRGSVN